MNKRLLCLCLIAFPFFAQAQNVFIENKGQVTDQGGQSRNDIDFKLKATNGLNLFVGNGQLHYQWMKAEQVKKERPTLPKMPQANNTPVQLYRMDITLMNANTNAAVIKENRQEYHERYYLASNNFSGATAASFEKITYKDIYPNIDWVLYRNNRGNIEYDFVVHPGGNVADIKLQYGGATSLILNTDKSLTATTPYGSVTENAPVAFEKETGKSIATAFALKDNTLSFSAASYNGTLVIDPTLIWGTYFGGTDGELAYDITSNKDGNTYMTGGTSSTANIATTGAYQTTYNGGGSWLNDAYIAKFNLAGECLWATYYGTSDEDCAKSITHDTAGNIYIAGYTISATGLGTEGSYQEESGGDYDAFIAKFDTNGNRIWSTYFGGPSTDCWGAVAIAADKHDNVYLTGQTASATGIATPDAYQTSLGDPFANNCLLAKFNIDGSLQWSTYYGGTQGDAPLGIATDTTGAVYIGGYTNSTTGIATPSGQQSTPGGDLDGFLSKFDPSGDLVWGTFFGGDNYDQINSVACDSQLNVYITGTTASTTGISTLNAHQPEYGGGFQDGMLAKYDASGALQWATYYGNSGEDGVDRVIVGHNQDIYVSGTSSGTDNIATPEGFQATPGGSFDAVISRFNAEGDLVWGSFLGGPDYDEAFGLSQDAADNLYIAGQTSSGAGIATDGAWQEGFAGGGDDGFLVVIKDCTPPITPDSISGLHTICAGSTNTYSVAAAPNTEYTWILPEGWEGNSTTSTIDAVCNEDGGVIKVVASNTCDVGDTVTLNVTVNPSPETPQITAEGPNLSTSNNYSSYQWSKDGSPIDGATSPSYTAIASGSYTVTVTNENGCTAASEPYGYNSTGVNVMNTDDVVVFPNPFSNTLNLQLPYEADIKICNAVGQTILKRSCKRGMNSIATDDIATGIYFLRVAHKGSTKDSIFKIVKAER